MSSWLRPAGSRRLLLCLLPASTPRRHLLPPRPPCIASRLLTGRGPLTLLHQGQQITLARPLQVSQGATVLEPSHLVPSRERRFCPYCRGSGPMLAPPLRPKPTLPVSWKGRSTPRSISHASLPRTTLTSSLPRRCDNEALLRTWRSIS